jgi:HEAT repeat protein
MNGTSIRISILAVIALFTAVAICQGPATPTSKGLSAAEELELKTLSGQLTDSARQAKTRVEAAELLLSRTYPQAAETLKAALADTGNRGGQIAVAEAIAHSALGRPEFLDPLMAMLTGEEPSIRAAAAKALAAYHDGVVPLRLIEIARDAKRPPAIRLEVIACLQKSLDQSVVGALVGLLEDRDPMIVEAAAGSLARLTNVTSFGADAARWRDWWAKNEHMPRSEWLAELAASFSRSQADLEAENARLRERLAKAMEDLYAAAPPAQRDGILLGYLKEPTGDVRLTGTRLLEKQIAAGDKVSPEVRAQGKAMLADPDSRVRQKAALLAAGLGDANVSSTLLERLAGEESADVRKALLTALGQVADAATLPAVLEEVKGKRCDVAAAAARALARLAAKQKLDPPLIAQVVQVLSQRYQQLARAEDGVDLPEALLTAMGAVRSEEFLPVLMEATKDAAASIRLAGVNGLRQFARTDVGPILEGLVADADRGVRQAVIAALGATGERKNLPVILSRTDPAVEADAAVRQQAWDAAMGILAKADAPTMKSVVTSLSSRVDAADQRIKVRQMLVASLRAAKEDELPDALRQLGADLVGAGRPAEAAPALGEACAALTAAKDPKAADVWREWVEALVAADDPAVAKVLADQSDEKAWAWGIQKMLARVEALPEKGKWQAIVQMSVAATNSLASRLSGEQVRRLQTMAEDAKSKLTEADRQKVPALVAQAASGDEAARKAAAGELLAMGERAISPLVDELKKAISGETEAHSVELAVLDVLKQVAPKLTGYDPAAPKADRLKVIETWMRK